MPLDISLSAGDLPESAGRGRRRVRNALLTSVTAFAARGTPLLVLLFTIPLILDYLGLERFGLWMTISSFLVMLGFLDFGLGNGVMNVVADAHGRDSRKAMAQAVASAFYALLALAAGLALVFALLYPFIPWASLLGARSPEAIAEAAPAVAMLVACLAVALPLSLAQRTLMGLQQGYMANLWQTLGSLLGLAGVVLAIQLHASLPILVLATAGVPMLAGLFTTLVFFGWSHRELRPRLVRVTTPMLSRVARLGLLFFVLQLAVAVGVASDNLIVARLLGAEAVAGYAVPAKLFGMVSLGLGLFLSPLWPAYGEAIARGDRHWARTTLVRSLLLTFGVAAAAAAVLLLFAPQILRLWVGEGIDPSLTLLVGLAVWTVLESCGAALAMFLNGAAIVRPQLVVASLFTVTSIGLRLVLVSQWDVAGIAWGAVVAYLFTTALPYAVLVPRIVRAWRPR